MRIGVFDSGVGGLTVVKEILGYLSAPEDRLIYFGDTARVPYGTKSRDTVVKFAREIAAFLLEFDIDEIVVACHTASSFALDVLKSEFSVPVRGVIKPGIEEALNVTKSGIIGVIGTSSTISSRSYDRQLAFMSDSIELVSRSCPLLVPLVEEGWLQDSVTESVVHRYLDSFKDSNIDALILGCTHYPLLKPVIRRVMGNGVEVVDSAYAVAKELSRERCLEGSSREDIAEAVKKCDFFVSDEEERFKIVGEKFLGVDMHNVKRIDINGYMAG